MASTTALLAVSAARLLVTVLILVAVVAAGTSVEAASVTVTWNAPTTNADGTPLTDLAEYRIYLGTAVPTCPGGSFHPVSSPTTTPGSGQTVSARVTALNAGTTYFARITAADFDGNESACSSSASGVAQPDFDVTPTTTTSFGSVAVNGTVDRTFTVQSTSRASISGTASVGAPFSIVSGGSFSLQPGDSQTVTVRFRPTAVGSFAGNVNFVAGSDSVSRGVSGSAVSGGPTAPPPPSSPTDPPADAGSPSVTQLVADAGGVTFAIAWAPAGGAASYGYVAAFNDGSALQQGTVTATSLQLRMPYHVSAALGGFVCIRSIGATGLQSTDQSCNAVPPANPGSSPPPLAPGAPSVTRTATAASGVTFTIAWGAVSGATSFRWVAAFNDGSATQQGTVTSRSFQLRMPYHASGAAFGAAVCIRSVNATGQQSTDQACSPVSVPARSVAPPPPPPPPPPEPPPNDYGWGIG